MRGILSTATPSVAKPIPATQTLAANGTLAVTIKIAKPLAGTAIYLRLKGKLFGPGVVSADGTVAFKGITNTTAKYEVVQKRWSNPVKVTGTIAVVAKKK